MNRSIIYALLLVVVGGAIGNAFRFAGVQPDRAAELDSIPLTLPGYQGQEDFFDPNTYDVLNATMSTFRRYAGADGSRCDLFVAYFASQHFGAGIHSPLVCLPGGGWRIESHEAYKLTFPDGIARSVNRLHISLGNQSNIMYYWYQTRMGKVRTEIDLKLALFKSALALRPTDAAIVRFTVPVVGRDFDDADRQALAFMTNILPSVTRALPF